MAHTYTSVRIHLVFSTDQRKNLIFPDLQPRMWDYIGGIGRTHGIPVHAVGGIENHCHVLVSLPRDVTIAKCVQILKAYSSKWVNENKFMTGGRFAWQEGYSAFSVSESKFDPVVEYIRNQTEHHHDHSFEDERKALLVKHNIPFVEEEVFA